MLAVRHKRADMDCCEEHIVHMDAVETAIFAHLLSLLHMCDTLRQYRLDMVITQGIVYGLSVFSALYKTGLFAGNGNAPRNRTRQGGISN